MRLFQALKIFKIEDNTLTRKELKKIFREFLFKYHPDKGGDEEIMKEILNAFEILKEQYSFKIESQDSKSFEEDKNFWNIDNPEMEEVYRKICSLEGIKIEVCGYWLWVTGETYKNKKALKEAGLFYAKKKVSWYWRPKSETKKKRRGSLPMNKIRAKYGSKNLKVNINIKLK